MTPNEERLLTAMLIGPMDSLQLSMAVCMSRNWTLRTLRRHATASLVIRIAMPHHVTGKLWWRYALTNTGTLAAHKRISLCPTATFSS